jgi:hypothetical protein
MNLESNFTDSKLGGGLLVKKTADHQGQHFALTRGEA